MLILRPGQSTFGPGGATEARAFDERTVSALRSNLTGVRASPPPPRRTRRSSWRPQLRHDRDRTDSNYFAAQDWSFREGRPFTDSEIRSGASVCVIGATIVSELYGTLDPLGSRSGSEASPAR